MPGGVTGNAATKWQKFPLFAKDSPCTGEPFDQFLQLLGAFIRPTILHYPFTFDAMRFTGYGVIAETPSVVIYPNFSVHTVGKTMHWIEKLLAPF